MKQQPLDIEQLTTAEHTNESLYGLIRSISPSFRVQMRSLCLKDEKILFEVESILSKAFGMCVEDAMDYYANVCDTLLCDYQISYPNAKDEDLRKAVCFMTYFAAFLLDSCEDGKNELYTHRYAEEICISARSCFGSPEELKLRDQLLCRMECHYEDCVFIMKNFKPTMQKNHGQEIEEHIQSSISKKQNARMQYDYALTDWGKKHEEEAKNALKKTMKLIPSVNAGDIGYAILELKELKYINTNSNPTALIRLLKEWGIDVDCTPQNLGHRIKAIMQGMKVETNVIEDVKNSLSKLPCK